MLDGWTALRASNVRVMFLSFARHCRYRRPIQHTDQHTEASGNVLTPAHQRCGGLSADPSVRYKQEVFMAGTVKPIPDGYPVITPYLCVDGASQAIEFYTRVRLAL